MNPDTGEIYEDVDKEKARARGLVPLDGKVAAALLEMSPEKRPSVLLEMCKHHPLGKLDGMTDKDIRTLRNVAKRARRERRAKR